ncbi:hypothetical protein GCM10018793_12040 [Streptomyces sulfonofaciens]|uniref:Uncharacterized protein n=1 Tax=Streptomyces sulfonofaciens TaxID=68272 RepID=A0A919FVF8_9ACTN|nr:hypothetical protein GCM10018793_12040 [Streptomyces sulfonofaciens]
MWYSPAGNGISHAVHQQRFGGRGRPCSAPTTCRVRARHDLSPRQIGILPADGTVAWTGERRWDRGARGRARGSRGAAPAYSGCGPRARQDARAGLRPRCGGTRPGDASRVGRAETGSARPAGATRPGGRDIRQ